MVASYARKLNGDLLATCTYQQKPPSSTIIPVYYIISDRSTLPLCSCFCNSGLITSSSESRARRELWVLWFMALIEARHVGEAGDEEGADDVQGETDPEATEDDEHAEGETDPEATEEDEDAEGDTDPKSSRRTRSKRTRGKSRRRDEACIVSLHFLQFFSGPWLYDRAR